MTINWVPAVYTTGLAAICVYAYVHGAVTERIGAAIVGGASVLTWLAVFHPWPVFRSVEQWVLVVDIATWTALLRLALKSNRFWPLWATAFQTVALITHIAVLIDPAIVPKAYAFGQGLWAYPILLTLLVGTERHRRLMAMQTRLPSPR